MDYTTSKIVYQNTLEKKKIENVEISPDGHTIAFKYDKEVSIIGNYLLNHTLPILSKLRIK